MKRNKTLKREMGREIFPGIEVDPERLGGKPVIKGTRISVESILERLAAGEQEEDILEAHPHLKREDIRRALALAAKMLSKEEFVFVSEAA